MPVGGAWGPRAVDGNAVGLTHAAVSAKDLSTKAAAQQSVRCVPTLLWLAAKCGSPIFGSRLPADALCAQIHFLHALSTAVVLHCASPAQSLRCAPAQASLCTLAARFPDGLSRLGASFVGLTPEAGSPDDWPAACSGCCWARPTPAWRCWRAGAPRGRARRRWGPLRASCSWTCQRPAQRQPRAGAPRRLTWPSGSPRSSMPSRCPYGTSHAVDMWHHVTCVCLMLQSALMLGPKPALSHHAQPLHWQQNTSG